MRSLEREKVCIHQVTTMKRRGHAQNPMIKQHKEFNVQKIQSNLDDDHKLAKVFRALKLRCGN
jgi:hypothetical protein